MELVKFGATLRRTEGEGWHPLVILLPIFLLRGFPMGQSHLIEN